MRTDDRHARAGRGCSDSVLPCGAVPCSRQNEPDLARRMAVRILGLTIVLISAAGHLPWAGEQALAQPAAPNIPEETLREYAQRNQIRQAYGVYLAGKKVGWFIEELRVGEHEGQAVALLSDEAKFSVQFLGLKSETEALEWRGNPLDMAEQIAQGGYPMLHICGEADVTVPIEENTDPFERKVRAAGGDIRVIRKPGVGHHPHSLADPKPIVDFILRATGQLSLPQK